MKKVLLFNINFFKKNQIMGLCNLTGFGVYEVKKEDYYKSIGEIAKGNGSKKHPKYLGDELSNEMMVVVGASSEELDSFFEEWKKENIQPVARKAVMTVYNMAWNPLELYRDLDEHCKR